jgi:hypothetical protein
VRIDNWFLTAAERGDPATGLDARRGMAWSAGNEVRPLSGRRRPCGQPAAFCGSAWA